MILKQERVKTQGANDALEGSSHQSGITIFLFLRTNLLFLILKYTDLLFGLL